MSKENKEKNDSSEPAPTFLTPETSEENLVNFTICPNQDCLSPIEILSINQENNIIVFKCFKENKEFTISIKEYIEKIKDKRNIDEFKENCKEHKSNNICYCFDCKKHLCNECLKTMNHIYHKKTNIIEIKPIDKELNIVNGVIEEYKNKIKKLKDEKENKETEFKKLLKDEKEKEEKNLKKENKLNENKEKEEINKKNEE